MNQTKAKQRLRASCTVDSQHSTNVETSSDNDTWQLHVNR